MSPTAGANDYAQSYAQYYAATGVDPYAAYGGYEAYMKMYYEYYAQQQAGVQQPMGDQPPPPPADNTAPPVSTPGFKF